MKTYYKYLMMFFFAKKKISVSSIGVHFFMDTTGECTHEKDEVHLFSEK